MRRRPFLRLKSAGRAGSTGLARALSKLGICSRSQAWECIRAGRVRVNQQSIRDPERRVQLGRDRIEVDGVGVSSRPRVYLMLNKPRGLVTTRADEKQRSTVYSCLDPDDVPFVSPVGRLDQASEGLLLFTNDTAWAARITDPLSHLDKTYHVQVDCLADSALLAQLRAGIQVNGARLAVRRASLLRSGEKNSWLEIVLAEGKNRHIRRLLAACGVEVLRLVRVAVGPLRLGTLAKGQARALSAQEVRLLRGGPAAGPGQETA